MIRDRILGAQALAIGMLGAWLFLMNRHHERVVRSFRARSAPAVHPAPALLAAEWVGYTPVNLADVREG